MRLVSVGTRCPQPDHQYDGGHGARLPRGNVVRGEEAGGSGGSSGDSE